MLIVIDCNVGIRVLYYGYQEVEVTGWSYKSGLFVYANLYILMFVYDCIIGKILKTSSNIVLVKNPYH